MRIVVLFIICVALSVYAYRDWYKSLCGLILLMPVISHPDMPTYMWGIQGMNPFNLVLLNVLFAWVLNRRRERLRWDMPRKMTFLLAIYLLVVLVGFYRMIDTPSDMESIPSGYLYGEYLINTIKWVIPGLLLYEGCTTKKRLYWGLICTLLIYLLLAALVAKWISPMDAIRGDVLGARALKSLVRGIGYHRVNLSMMLSGAFWAVLLTAPLWRWRHRIVCYAGAILIAYGQALTGGRMGYVTWGCVGLLLGILKWRRFLPIVVIVPLFIITFLPGVRERMLLGIEMSEATGQLTYDAVTVSAGRTLAWSLVVEKIKESPWVGFGREAMVRSGITAKLFNERHAEFAHPHNAYLEILLDNGLIGGIPIIIFYLATLFYSFRLMKLETREKVFPIIGGVAFALVSALLIASAGSQTFYPREGAVGMWCAIGLMLRVYVERKRVLRQNKGALENDFEDMLSARPARTKRKKLMFKT
jgi:hypothetical protein